jgi:hypothetical protein
VNFPPIGPHALGRRAAMELGHPGFMAVVAPPEANAARRIAARLGHSAARVEAPADARALSARLRETDADPVIVSGLDGLTDNAWRQLDRLRDRFRREGLTVLVLSPPSAERLSRHAPNLASLFGAGFFTWEDTPEAPPDPASADVAQAEFDRLAQRWRDETAVLSSLTRRIRHPAYQAIIAMGEQAIRPILRDLEREPQPWGPALHAITGALPVPAADAGRVARVANAWLAWARENGYAW